LQLQVIVEFVDAGDEHKKYDAGEDYDADCVNPPSVGEEPGDDSGDSCDFIEGTGENQFAFDDIGFEVVMIFESGEEGFDTYRETESGEHNGGSQKEHCDGGGVGFERHGGGEEGGGDTEEDGPDEEPDDSESEVLSLVGVG